MSVGNWRFQAAGWSLKGVVEKETAAEVGKWKKEMTDVVFLISSILLGEDA